MPPQNRNPASRATGSRRHRFGFRPVGAIADPLLRSRCDPGLLALVRLLREWPRIAGGELGRHSRPLRIRRDRRGSVLHLCTGGAFATELEHRRPVLVERINAALGAGTVDDIRIVQTGGPEPAARPPRRADPPPAPPRDDRWRQRIARSLASIRNPELRAAVERLHHANLTGGECPAPRPGRPVS